eukprot:g769.t1
MIAPNRWIPATKSLYRANIHIWYREKEGEQQIEGEENSDKKIDWEHTIVNYSVFDHLIICGKQVCISITDMVIIFPLMVTALLSIRCPLRQILSGTFRVDSNSSFGSTEEAFPVQNGALDEKQINFIDENNENDIENPAKTICLVIFKHSEKLEYSVWTRKAICTYGLFGILDLCIIPFLLVDILGIVHAMDLRHAFPLYKSHLGTFSEMSSFHDEVMDIFFNTLIDFLLLPPILVLGLSGYRTKTIYKILERGIDDRARVEIFWQVIYLLWDICLLILTLFNSPLRVPLVWRLFLSSSRSQKPDKENDDVDGHQNDVLYLDELDKKIMKTARILQQNMLSFFDLLLLPLIMILLFVSPFRFAQASVTLFEAGVHGKMRTLSTVIDHLSSLDQMQKNLHFTIRKSIINFEKLMLGKNLKKSLRAHIETDRDVKKAAKVRTRLLDYIELLLASAKSKFRLEHPPTEKVDGTQEQPEIDDGDKLKMKKDSSIMSFAPQFENSVERIQQYITLSQAKQYYDIFDSTLNILLNYFLDLPKEVLPPKPEREKEALKIDYLVCKRYIDLSVKQFDKAQNTKRKELMKLKKAFTTHGFSDDERASPGGGWSEQANLHYFGVWFKSQEFVRSTLMYFLLEAITDVMMLLKCLSMEFITVGGINELNLNLQDGALVVSLLIFVILVSIRIIIGVIRRKQRIRRYPGIRKLPALVSTFLQNHSSEERALLHFRGAIESSTRPEQLARVVLDFERDYIRSTDLRRGFDVKTWRQRLQLRGISYEEVFTLANELKQHRSVQKASMPCEMRPMIENVLYRETGSVPLLVVHKIMAFAGIGTGTLTERLTTKNGSIRNFTMVPVSNHHRLVLSGQYEFAVTISQQLLSSNVSYGKKEEQVQEANTKTETKTTDDSSSSSSSSLYGGTSQSMTKKSHWRQLDGWKNPFSSGGLNIQPQRLHKLLYPILPHEIIDERKKGSAHVRIIPFGHYKDAQSTFSLSNITMPPLQTESYVKTKEEQEPMILQQEIDSNGDTIKIKHY